MPDSGSGRWIQGPLGGFSRGKNNLGNVWSVNCEFQK